ncbi:MAG: hypothetical protein ACTHJ7_05465 [Candidatus Nitrosocosmicus sp.]
MNIKIKIPSIVIVSVIAAMVISINLFAFGQSTPVNQTSASNKTASTTSNSTANNNSGVCSNAEVTYLGAAVKSFLSRDNNGALMHMNEAAKTLSGAPKMHLDEAIRSLQSGEISGARMQLQESQYACGIPDLTA